VKISEAFCPFKISKDSKTAPTVNMAGKSIATLDRVPSNHPKIVQTKETMIVDAPTLLIDENALTER
jgi:hypothetical protein